jgi:hypothetical protein
MLELALSDEVVTPRVELLDGPRVRLTISASENIAHGLEFCRSDLIQAVESAFKRLHEQDVAPARIFIRADDTSEVISTVDPTITYGSKAIVRP